MLCITWEVKSWKKSTTLVLNELFSRYFSHQSLVFIGDATGIYTSPIYAVWFLPLTSAAISISQGESISTHGHEIIRARSNDETKRIHETRVKRKMIQCALFHCGRVASKAKWTAPTQVTYFIFYSPTTRTFPYLYPYM